MHKNKHSEVCFLQGRDLLLFLPGVSGVNFEAEDQFDILSASFDVWSMEIRDVDNSTFLELTQQVCVGGSVAGWVCACIVDRVPLLRIAFIQPSL